MRREGPHNGAMSMNEFSAYLRELSRDPKRNMPVAIALGAAKGALVGLAIGKLTLATAAGMAGGAVVGAALSWRNKKIGDIAPNEAADKTDRSNAP